MGYILGIWDGHDAGAALVHDSSIVFAVNEERYTRRKLEVCFPRKSIQAIISQCSEIQAVALSTSDFVKTMTRFVPEMKESYYLTRRRLRQPTAPSAKLLKYKVTEFGTNSVLAYLSKKRIKKELASLGLVNVPIYVIDHHECHAQAAARLSGFNKTLVITLDGLGDGLSGTVSTYRNSVLTRVASLPATDSIGIFFEHVTNILNMRELEDEGKVMAMAAYAYPVKLSENAMLDFFEIKNLSTRAKYNALQMYRELKKIHWKTPSEQFAFMAQQCLEHWVLKLVGQARSRYNYDNICLAGGVFANIKLNRKIRTMKGIKQCFIFPHMGDGGLAVGAAVALNYRLNRVGEYNFKDVFLGNEYSTEQIRSALKSHNLKYASLKDPARAAAELIAKNKIIIWFQGKMEYGPRALGHRSILAAADSSRLKDRLNIYMKKRVWFQPFCPSILDEDAARLLADFDGVPNPFMTMAYMINEDHRKDLEGVIGIDGSCRPQIVTRDNAIFYKLLTELKRLKGFGVVLNTSLNIHGSPIACSPENAIDIFLRTKVDNMLIGDLLVGRV